MLNVFRALSVFNAREDGSKSLINESFQARGKVKKFGGASINVAGIALHCTGRKRLLGLTKDTPGTPGSTGSELWLKNLICIQRRSLSQDNPLQDALKLPELESGLTLTRMQFL